MFVVDLSTVEHSECEIDFTFPFPHGAERITTDHIRKLLAGEA